MKTLNSRIQRLGQQAGWIQYVLYNIPISKEFKIFWRDCKRQMREMAKEEYERGYEKGNEDGKEYYGF